MRLLVLALMLAMGVMLSACGGLSGRLFRDDTYVRPTPDAGLPSATPIPASPNATSTRPAVQTTATPSGPPAGGEVSGTSTPVAPTTGGSHGPTLKVATHPKYGHYITDERGMTLYMFLDEAVLTSNCYDRCAEEWPPLLTRGKPLTSDGIDSRLLGTTQRKDGTLQVTFNGMSLYYYFLDAKPGDVTGQGVGDLWWLVSPSGQKIIK